MNKVHIIQDKEVYQWSMAEKRDGAGRKPLKVPREKLVVYVTSDEQAAVKDLLNGLRSQSSLEEVDSNTLALALELSYENEIANLKMDNEIEITNLKIIHKDEISTLKSKFREQWKNLVKEYEDEIDALELSHEDEMDALKSDFADEISTLKSTKKAKKTIEQPVVPSKPTCKQCGNELVLTPKRDGTNFMGCPKWREHKK